MGTVYVMCCPGICMVGYILLLYIIYYFDFLNRNNRISRINIVISITYNVPPQRVMLGTY